MYEITYLDIEENPEYEQIIKDVIKECYKEEFKINSSNNTNKPRKHKKI